MIDYCFHSQLSTRTCTMASNPTRSSSLNPSVFSQSISSTPITFYKICNCVRIVVLFITYPVSLTYPFQTSLSPRSLALYLFSTYAIDHHRNHNLRVGCRITCNVSWKLMNVLNDLSLLCSRCSTTNTLSKWDLCTCQLFKHR